MTAFTDLLPPTKSEPHGAITWQPQTAPGSGLAGVLTVTGKRSHTRYLVSENKVDGGGRAFSLRKTVADGGAVYSCFLRTDGGRECDCAGFFRHQHCRHTAALAVLIENEQL